MTELHATKRDTVSKGENKRLRAAGKIPAVVYGKKEDSQTIALDAKDFMHVWHEAGESTVLTLKGLDGDKDVLIQTVDTDPVYGQPLHADLYAVDRTTKVEVAVPITFDGVSPAEKELGGVLIKVHHELTISALPKDLPHEIVADISGIKDFETQLHAKDIALPSGVELAMDPDEVIALAQVAKEEEDVDAAAPDMEAIEVEKKGKAEEETPAE